MRNNLYLLPLFGILLSATTSCKKKTETCRLGKHYVSDGNSTPAPDVFTYNNSGNLQSIAYSNGLKDSVGYSADTITIYTRDNAGNLVATYSGILGSNGFIAAATKTTYDLSGNITGTDNISYEYNNDGYLTKQVTSNGSGSTILSLTYTAGNATTGTLHNGAILNQRYFFFYNTAANKTGIDDKGNIALWTGRASASLLDSIFVITPAIGDTSRIQYWHQLDANDYVHATTQTFRNSGVSTKYHTYHYIGCE